MISSIIPLKPELAQEIISWVYEPPYDLYDHSRDNLPGLLNPEYHYHAVIGKDGALVGYCCFGLDAQVPGGDYQEGEPEVLDIGVGMRPELTGQGFGRRFVSRIEEYAIEKYSSKRLRVTIAAFNQRSLKVFRSCGYQDTFHFTRDLARIKFIQLEKII